MSHDNYNSHVKSKRQEVIQFRNDLINRFTNPLAKIKRRDHQQTTGIIKSKSSMAQQETDYQQTMKSKNLLPTEWIYLSKK